ncbi:MAG: TIGR02646 family protein [Magnetococcus sp. DMHC-1]
MSEGNSHDADNGIYAHASVKEALKLIYGSKCAYCECLIEAQADRRVDHYRPRHARDRGDAHPGYYWLTYEWSNLVLTCAACNNKKSNQFPVTGTRVVTPPRDVREWHPDSKRMRGEQPLLLNPEIDLPEEHLQFLPDGRIQALNNSQRGNKTIDICRLDREELDLTRKKLIDDFRDDLKKQLLILIDQYNRGFYKTPHEFHEAMILGFKTIVDKIRDAGQPARPFSRVGWYINHDPERFLLACIPAGEPREIVREALRRCGLAVSRQ